MKKALILYSILMSVVFLPAQSIFTGRVSDASGQSIPGANVYLKGSFDGEIGRASCRERV